MLNVYIAVRNVFLFSFSCSYKFLFLSLKLMRAIDATYSSSLSVSSLVESICSLPEQKERVLTNQCLQTWIRKELISNGLVHDKKCWFYFETRDSHANKHGIRHANAVLARELSRTHVTCLDNVKRVRKCNVNGDAE